jgi:hypothetical protein
MDYCTIELKALDEIITSSLGFKNLFNISNGTNTALASGPDYWAEGKGGSLRPVTSEYLDLLTTNESGFASAIQARSIGAAAGYISPELIVELDFIPQFDTVVNFTITHNIGMVSVNRNVLVYTSIVELTDNLNVNDVTPIYYATQHVAQRTLTTSGTDVTITLNNVKLSAYKRYGISIKGITTNSVIGEDRIYIDQLSATLGITSVCHAPLMAIIDIPRASKIFQRVVYHYSGSNVGASLERRNARHAASQSRNDYYSSSLATAAYFDDELAQFENSRYVGCRISAPDINLPITTENATAILGTPVIEVYETNANQLIFTQAPESRGGTGNTEPGNLLVR